MTNATNPPPANRPEQSAIRPGAPGQPAIAPRGLAEALAEHVAAASPGIWVQSFEHEDAIAEICLVAAADGHDWTVAVWDCDRGLWMPGVQESAAAGPTGLTDPVAAVKAIKKLAPSDPDGATLLVLPNFHRFIDSADMVQVLANELWEGRTRRTFIVVLSPLVKIPVELERMFVVIDHPLPAAGEIEQIARSVADESERPDGAALARMLDAAAGMTRMEAESAMALSLVRKGRLDAETIWEAKAGMLRRSGLLRLHRGSERFEDLGGMEALKSFCRSALADRPAGPDRGRARPRGVLLLGVPGTGKSAFAKALGNEIGRPTITLDVGALYGCLVGQTEGNVRQALAIADAMAPCVLFIDEIEKALSGSASSGRTDSGVSARLFGTLLTWLSDHESDVFVVATSNDVSALPPEFSRAERWDGVWFIDLPDQAERNAIWAIHRRTFDLEAAKIATPLIHEMLWTGAEIRSCCRLASLLGLPLAAAADHVVPLVNTAMEKVQELRHWATGRCLSASSGRLFHHEQQEPAKPHASGSRRVARAGVV